MIMSVVALGFFTACNNDDEEVAFELKSLMAGSVDLNGATGAVNVPKDAVITATFSKDVDPQTLNITLKQTYDNAEFDVTVNVNAKVVTITPAALGEGTG